MKRKNALLPEEAEAAEKRARRAVEALKTQGEKAAKAILAPLSDHQLLHVTENYSNLRPLF